MLMMDSALKNEIKLGDAVVFRVKGNRGSQFREARFWGTQGEGNVVELLVGFTDIHLFSVSEIEIYLDKEVEEV